MTSEVGDKEEGCSSIHRTLTPEEVVAPKENNTTQAHKGKAMSIGEGGVVSQSAQNGQCRYFGVSEGGGGMHGSRS